MTTSSRNAQKFDLHTTTTLSDYVTAIAWTPNGQTLAATSAAGEVTLWHTNTNFSILQPANEQSINCVAFSQDGKLLAVGGQDGKVKIWRWCEQKLINILENAPAWIDQLAWNPHNNQLAFSLGRYVQIWDADTSEIVVTLNFESSSVLGMDWRNDGNYLAIAGYQGVKIWNSQDWEEDPYILDVPGASVAIAWSPDGKYLASGNIDRTISVIEWQNPFPWVMRGFPAKIRQLAWSNANTQLGEPLLAVGCLDGIVVWEKQADSSAGWQGRVLNEHTGIVESLAFQPGTLLLASGATDGKVCLWQKAQRLGQILSGTTEELSCLAWHPQGKLLAAGCQNGELLIFSKSMRGQGFSR